MPTDLAHLIATGPLADTHEHQNTDADWQASPPDVLCDLFDGYSDSELLASGTPQAANAALFDTSRDVADRFGMIEPWWRHIQYTGYGEAVRIAARTFYDLDELTAEGLAAANERAADWRRPGARDRIFREIAGLDHVQIDSFTTSLQPDPVDPSYYHYDLSWTGFACGWFDLAALAQATGVEVTDPASLREALSALVAAQAPLAVAIKIQHAYERTLAWRERSDEDIAGLLERKRRGEQMDRDQLDTLGDWCLARAAELAATHGLPIKIHTGHLAGNGGMVPDRIRPAHLAPLLIAHPSTRFVLMHAGWPFGQELISLAKQFANVWGDCCWAWSMTPLGTRDFVRQWLHAAPLNKLMVFGGDTGWPTMSAAYAKQARAWLTRALQGEVDDGLLSEAQAVDLAGRLMVGNARAVFGL